MRGSNRLEDCHILLVAGTPALAPDELAIMARAIYCNDAEPLDETYDERTGSYADPRMQRLADYLTRAELTQCAHRNRPLRHDGRIVVTLCASEIDYLPITEVYEELPARLADDGAALKTRNREAAEKRMAEAAEELLRRGEPVTARSLAGAAGVRLGVACEWLRTARSTPAQHYVHLDPVSRFPNNIKESFSLGIGKQKRDIHNDKSREQSRINIAPALHPPATPPARSSVSFVERVMTLMARGLSEENAVRQILIERGALTDVAVGASTS
jgi:hypothetical protein